MEKGLLYFIKANRRIDLAALHWQAADERARELLQAELAEGKTGRTSLSDYVELYFKERKMVVDAVQLLLPGDRSLLEESKHEPSKIAKALADGLRRFKSYGGRIRFDRYLDLLDPGNHLYKDKEGSYQLIPGYSRRILPDVLAAAIADLWGQELISKDVRRLFEQHLVAIMNNYDYMACVHLDQLKELFCGDVAGMKTYFVLFGAAPVIFDESEYGALLSERFTQGLNFFEQLRPTIKDCEFLPVYCRKNYSDGIPTELKDLNVRNVQELPAWSASPDSKEAGKLTELALNFIYKELARREEIRRASPIASSHFNIVYFTSTFHIARLAMEVERKHFNTGKLLPDNTVIVGDASYHRMFDSARDTGCPEPERLYALKKVKSSLYDLLMHASDKNHRLD